ncbi:uncharacterized oxidoreductase At4g09670-like [Rhodamnia argentea]|uniref:Uncharacterized oxidoreductase At4g09670-like n=1 Tax=Rhodamnia argentea TaxID=178133 RepID=A0A8B8NHF5_9MYRT|nr:uncharacterized oxidoreductase At4g09670-like [Rhodamnia argentea]
MADNPVRFGIIGCAAIARKLCRAIALAPNATLHALGSRSIEKAKSFAAANRLSGAVKLYGSYGDVLDDPLVDAVYLPLPTSLHAAWAVSAARRGKHVLLEKPTAVDAAELDRILEACQASGVQFMDGTMWLHHPRTEKMMEIVSDRGRFGELKSINSISMFAPSREFFEDNIRVKPDLDSLGALGDLGWYCIGAFLWAAGFELPSAASALPDVTHSSAGVILSCSAVLYWGSAHETAATFHCSFLAHASMDLAVVGSNGSLHLKDFTIPIEEGSASFEFTPGAKFVDLHIGWSAKPEKVLVPAELPQEALMIREFASLVQGIRDSGRSPESKWPEISRKTQLVLDAVNKSIDGGCMLVHL